MIDIREPNKDEIKEMLESMWKNLRAPFKVEAISIKYEILKNKKQNKFVIAVSNKRIIGSAILTVTDDLAEISWVNVDKEFQNKGIGKKLMLFLHEVARAKGVNKIWLEARKSAEPFYKQLGYICVGNYFETKVSGTHIKMNFLI